ncbi:MAG: choice-of-anchor J domain-containing protein [Chitinophagales bacterium]
MKRLLSFIVLCAAFALHSNHASAQTLYSEDFDGGSLASKGFTVLNVDGLIGNTGLDGAFVGLSDSFTNNAWINSLSVGGSVCALSTSWYNPAGTSNDWLITPPITLTGSNLNIAWRDMALDPSFADGYNVLISTSAGNTVGSFNPSPIYTTTGAPATWTEQSVNLNTYAGQTVTFAFVNNSTDMYLLGIDSIRVSNLALDDVAVSQPRLSEYTAIPFEQAGTYFPSLVVTNQGINNANGVNVSCTVTDFGGNTVYTATMLGNTTIAPGASVAFNDGGSGFSPAAQIDLYTASFQVSINQNDIVPENDTASIQLFISDSLYARDEAVSNSQVEGSLGIGAGATGILGNNYAINSPTEAVGIQAFFDGNLLIGDTVRGYLYSTLNGLPANVISTTADFIVTAADTPVIRLDLLFPSQIPLGGGQTYSFMIEETSTVDNVGIYYSTNIFTPGATNANINGGAFDDLGNLGFPNPLLVRGLLAYTPGIGFAGLIDAGTANTTVNYCPGDSIPLVTDGSEVVPAGEAYQWLWTSNSDTIILSGVGTNYFGDINADLVAAMSTPIAPGSYTIEGMVTAGGGIADTTNNSFTINVLTANDPLCQSTPPPCPNPISVSASITADTCGQNTGAVSVTTTGGSGQIFYQWSPSGAQSSSISGLSAGSYSVQITDITGCDTTIAYTVPSVNPSITLSTSVTDESTGCDGSASVTVTSGNGPFTYQWNDPNQQTTNTASNLCAGSYTVTVSDGSGCSSSATVVVGSGTSPCPNPIAVSASITGDTCGQNTGAISVTTTGGSGQIFYQWSPGGAQSSSINGLSAGSYSVQITDITGCDTTVTYVVSSVNPSFSLSTSSTDESCGCDGSASVTVNGNGPFTYQWDDLNGQTTSTAADLCAGSYTVVVSDGSGCSSSATVTVGSAPSAVSVNVTSTDQTDATNPDGSASAFASGGTPPYSYLWSNGGTDAIINGLAAGSYSVDVTDANGCSGSASVTVTANIDTTTSILSMNWQAISLSPNPSSGDIHIQWTSQQAIPYTINVIDASGRQMISTQGQSVQGLNRVGVETSSLSAGLYQVVIQSHEIQIQLALTVTH